MYIGAIADDLTGGTDLALMLARGGMRVLQTIGVPKRGVDLADEDAVIISLKSRTIAAADAVAQSLSAANALLAAGASQLFFKYCSTFDSTPAGNIGPVIDVLLKRLGETRTIACPAFPANRRTIYKGHLFVGAQLLSESSMRDHPLTPMRDADLVRCLSAQSQTPVSLIDYDTVRQGTNAISKAIAASDGITIVDAIADADLKAIGSACRNLKLVTGGSALAMGLPMNFGLCGNPSTPSERFAVAAGRAVVLAGSCSTATRAQVAHAVAKGVPALAIDALAIAEGRFNVNDAVRFAEEHGDERPLIYSSAEPERIVIAQQRLGRERSGALVETFLAKVAHELETRGFTRFLVAGGETSGAVVSGLGVEALEIGPEIAPGVPWTRSRGRARPLVLALKSGNFGDEDFFTTAWEGLA